MKKKVLSMVVALLTVGGLMSAETPEVTADNTTTTVQDGKRGDRAGKPGRRVGKKQDKKRHGRHSDPFAGIELTADQKKAVENMRQEQRAELEQTRKERQAATRQTRKELQAKMNERVKNILTPEQYSQYEKNIKAFEKRDSTVYNKDKRSRRR